jgi:hypothetical protein
MSHVYSYINPELTHTGEPDMKLILNCMECDDEIVIAEVVAELIEAWNPHFETHTMCDRCIATKFNIDLEEIKAISNHGRKF